MTMFESLLNETETLEEALSIQPCLCDELTEREVEEIRTRFLEEKFGINKYQHFLIEIARHNKKVESWEKALNALNFDDLAQFVEGE